MLQVDPAKRPEISEVVADLESIALSRYVELKGSIVSKSVSLSFLVFTLYVILKFGVIVR